MNKASEEAIDLQTSLSKLSADIMVDFRINETLQTGAVGKPHRIGAVGNSAYQTRRSKVSIYF